MHPLSNPSLSFHVPLCLIQILNMTKLFGKPLRVNKAAQDRNSADVGANLFIGGLSPEVDEKVRRRPFACKQPVAGSFSGPPAHASYSLPAASLRSQLPVPANPAPPLPPPPSLLQTRSCCTTPSPRLAWWSITRRSCGTPTPASQRALASSPSTRSRPRVRRLCGPCVLCVCGGGVEVLRTTFLSPWAVAGAGRRRRRWRRRRGAVGQAGITRRPPFLTFLVSPPRMCPYQ